MGQIFCSKQDFVITTTLSSLPAVKQFIATHAIKIYAEREQSNGRIMIAVQGPANLLQRHLQLPEDVQMRLPNKIILCCAVM
jgi:hypothetical protein